MDSIPASRSNSTNPNSVALELLRGALPVMTRKFDTRRLVEGLDGIRYEVSAIHPARTNRTVVRNEKTPFNLCTVVCIVLWRRLFWSLDTSSQGVWECRYVDNFRIFACADRQEFDLCLHSESPKHRRQRTRSSGNTSNNFLDRLNDFPGCIT
jgi:hypothetical protein